MKTTFPNEINTIKEIWGSKNIASHIPFGHIELNEQQHKWVMRKRVVFKFMK